MTLKKDRMDAARRHTPPVHTPRLRLKPKAPQSGYVDGAWWPHSANLTADLPDLLSVLSVRLGPIGRVIYNVNEWETPPAKFATGGRTVRLDGYRLQPVNTPSKSSGWITTKSSYWWFPRRPTQTRHTPS